MNKHKTIKMILCLCLALVMLFSPVMDTAANAVVIESWMVYTLITYMAALGITFTVAGGVDAMTQAMEEKVKDYEQANNIIDFYDIMRKNNVRIVPNNNKAPNGNPLFDIFITAAAVEGIQAFVNWLTSEGGWNKGSEINSNISNFIIENAVINDTETPILTSDITSNDGIFTVNFAGTYFPAETFETRNAVKLYMKAGSDNPYLYFYNDGIYLYCRWSDNSAWASRAKLKENTEYYLFSFDYGVNDITGRLTWYAVLTDGTCVYVDRNTFQTIKGILPITSDLSVNIPSEIPTISPLPNQGVSIKDAISVPMGDPTLEEWAENVKETFELTGTIPQPIPQITTNPDYQPDPTPVPTPNPSPEYEDVESLGLPALGDALMDKFPFCLPEDLGRLLNIFTAERQTPKWEVDLYAPLHGRIPMQGDTMLTIDLAEYEEIGQITRWASVIGFCLFLLVVTKEFITW